jgi:phenylalanyl-tRNA synthetase beta chain
VRVSVNWLRRIVPGLEGSPPELSDALGMAVTGVEEIIPVGRGLDGIVVARVLEVRKHPDADRLSLCRVDAGAEPVEVVCGAPIIHEGGLYPFIAAGGTLPGGMRIEEREIRGVRSHGMLCSERELGLGPDASGILRLPDGLEPGTDVAEALDLPDAALELEITPNRGDLACHVGVARELAAEAGLPLRLPPIEGSAWEPAWSDGEGEAAAAGVTVHIEDGERCGRYLGAVVRDVRVGPSPAWLQGRLRAVGARPINNVVDATNYVLRELNQPLHAFDLAGLRGAEIRVRAARSGERLRTLDGVERQLEPVATVIADAEGPVAVAGVMGGQESEVTAATTDVFLECAWFDPKHTRHTARSLELATDASYRFERWVDRHGCEEALTRCVRLILATAGGEAESTAVRVGPLPGALPVVPLRPSRVERLLGIRPDEAELEELLAPLGFERGTGKELAFHVPGWREADVRREVDLIEEVARRHGYERFAAEPRPTRPSVVPDDPAFARSDRVRGVLQARGFLEARSSSLVSRSEADPERPVELLHPLSAQERFLRGALVPVLLRRLEHNYARGERDVRLYEIGTTFRRREPVGDEVPVEEELHVGVLLTGLRRPRHWSEEARAADVWDLKGVAEEVAERLCGAAVEPLPGTAGPDAGPGPARFAAASWLGAEGFVLVGPEGPVGVAGRVRSEAVDAPPWAAPVWALEFSLDAVELPGPRAYRALSSFPAVPRDLALAVPEAVTAREVEAVILEAAPSWLEELRLFDVYEGEGVEAGRRSLAFRFRFRAPDRTLEDAEVEDALKEIIRRLEERCDARVRSA